MPEQPSNRIGNDGGEIGLIYEEFVFGATDLDAIALRDAAERVEEAGLTTDDLIQIASEAGNGRN